MEKCREMVQTVDMNNENILRYHNRMVRLHSIQKFSRTEWEVSNREGYTCTVNLIEDDPAYSCNLPQLKKMPCAHVNATCTKERHCANINTYSLCAPWYTLENYNKAYVGLFHHVPDSQYWPEISGLTILSPEVRRSWGHPPSVRIRGTIDEGCEGHRRNRFSNCK